MIKRIGDYKNGFKYIKDNKEIKDEDELLKIKSYKIPPAYNDVVIVNTKKIIAYGFDSKGRKQVIYTPEFIKKQSDKKFKKIFQSLKLFEKIKRKITKDMKNTDQKKKEIAMIIFLIFNCGFRIGNKKYEKTNNSIGLTTLKVSHLKFKKNSQIEIDFIGKKGVRNLSICSNKIIYNYLKKKVKSLTKDDYVFSCKLLGTSETKETQDDEDIRQINSKDVNEYLKSIDKNVKLTSKDLRTWNANHLFMKYYDEIIKDSKDTKNIKDSKDTKSNKKKIKNPVKKAIEMVANKLHNTYSICKKSYIDPKVIKYAEDLQNKYLNKNKK